MKKDQKKGDPLAKRTTSLPRKSVGSVLWYHYYFSASFLFLFFLNTSGPDVSVSLSFQTYPWKWHTSCDWTQKAALELYFEGETTEPQLMPCSPLVWTTVNRFSLREILEDDCHTKFSLSRSFSTNDNAMRLKWQMWAQRFAWQQAKTQIVLFHHHGLHVGSRLVPVVQAESSEVRESLNLL